MPPPSTFTSPDEARASGLSVAACATTDETESSTGEADIQGTSENENPLDLSTPEGIDIRCNWHTITDGLSDLAWDCGKFIWSCGKVIVTLPETLGVSAIVGAASCGYHTANCAEAASERIPELLQSLNRDGGYYQCDAMECSPWSCSETEPSFYPGTKKRNPNSTQRACYNAQLSRHRDEGTSDAELQKFADTCGCETKSCAAGRPPAYVGGPY